MKKIMCVISAVMLMLFVVACSSDNSKNIKDNEVKFVFLNKTGESISGISLNYSVNGENVGNTFIGSGVTVNDGEDFEHIFSAADMNNVSGYIDFSSVCSVTNANNKSVDCINDFEIEIEYGKSYTIMIDGNSTSGFHLSKISSIDK